MVGHSLKIFESGNIPSTVLDEIWRTIKEGTTWTGILDNQRADGTRYNDRVAIYPVMGEQGRIAHFIGIQTELPAVESAD